MIAVDQNIVRQIYLLSTFYEPQTRKNKSSFLTRLDISIKLHPFYLIWNVDIIGHFITDVTLGIKAETRIRSTFAFLV